MPHLILQSFFAPKKRLLTFMLFFCLVTISSNAQNLITNGNFESTGGYTSNYSLISAPFSGNSSSGQYAITTNPKPVNTINFMTSTDHSGSGNMMVVDGQNSDVFWKYTNLPIQAGLNYTFTYWVKNINSVTDGTNPTPQISLILSNQCPCSSTLTPGSSQTVNNSGSAWQKVSYTINVAGSGTKYIHFELATIGAGGGGNDFAIDDLSLYAPPAPLTISTSITNPSCPTDNDGTIVAYPNGGVTPFTFNLAGTATATNTTGIFQNLAGGTYTVSVTDSNSPASTVTTGTITLVAPLDLTLSESPSGCHLSGDPVTLTAANGNGTYNWVASPGGVLAGTGNSITVNPTTTTTYTVSSTITPPSVGNLIGNPGFENGTSGFYSDYGYSLTNTSGTQFAYGIVKNPSLWYNKFTTCGDKTTGTGNMLVADGATAAGSVVWSQTVPVESSKNYTFSFWVQNIGDGSKATFNVSIDGVPTTIALIPISPISATNNVTAGTPATTVCNWTNITGTWASGSNTLATIKIIDSNISGGGNDFAIDDISFSTVSSKVCNLSKAVTINIGGTPPVTTFSYTTPVCKSGTNPSPTGAVGFVTGGTYSDSNATGLLSINSSTGVINLAASTAGTYTVKYSVTANAATCQLAGFSTFDITIDPIPVLTITNPSAVCSPATVDITAPIITSGSTGGGTLSYWTNAAATISLANPNAIATSGTYYIKSTSGTCSDIKPVTVSAKPVGGSLALICGSLTTPTSVQFDWNNIAGITSFDYSYSIAGDPAVTGNIAAPSQYTVTTLPNQPVTFTLSPIGSVCVLPQTITCGCPAQIINTVSNKVACAADAVSQINFTTSDAYDSVRWTNDNPSIGLAANGNSFFIPAFNAANTLTTQIANITVILTKDGCDGTPRTFKITINPLPVLVITNPAAVCSPGTVNITAPAVTAGSTGGGVLTYWTNAAATIALTAPTAVTGGTYYIKSTAGTCIDIKPVVVTVNTSPVLTITNPAAVCSSATVDITVPAVTSGSTGGGTLSYWTNAAATTALVMPTAIAVAGTYYIKSTSGTCTDIKSVVVSFNPLPTATISGTTGVCSGTGTNITFAGTPNITVTYTINTVTSQTIVLDATGKATVLTGNLTATTVYNLVSATNNTILCSQAQTGSATVTINPGPTATATPTTQKICSGEQTGILLNSNVVNTTFSWIVVSQTGASGATAGSGNTISQVLTATGTTLGTVTYSVTPTANGCVGNPITVTIDVAPAPKVTATPSSQSICSGDVTSFVLSSNLAGITYDWNVVQTNVTGASAGSGTAISQTLTTIGDNAGQAVYTITPKLNGCYGLPISVVIDVNPMPVASANPATETLCSGETTNIALTTTNVVGSTFTWTVSQTGVSGATAGSGANIAQKLTTTGPISGTVEYTITPSKNNCPGSSIKVIITVNPTPEVFGPANTTICSGESPNISLSPNITGTTFAWTVVQTGVTGATDGIGNSINQILETSGLTQGSVIYRVTPTLNGCEGKSLDIKVFVNPLPVPELTDGAICVDQASNIAFQTYKLNTGLSNSTYNFEWYFEGILIPGEVSSTHDAIEAGEYMVIATNKVTGCVSLPITANVTASFPGQSIATTQTLAFADDATITVTVTGGNGTYEYRLDDGPFQLSNVFTNVSAGPHIVTVGDTNGCTNLTEDVFIIGYPKFFTPNGDGYNDAWNLVGLSDQPEAKIYIFDRYGKLLKQISSAGEGWDGTYTGQLMPATDYWFTVDFMEESITKQFKAHFSLKR
jgi:gliding motility-associated-like protein